LEFSETSGQNPQEIVASRPKPLFLGICDECKRDKPIVVICIIGCRLCAACQEKQNRISHEELASYLAGNDIGGW
jgi:hypothetical protein